MQPDIFKYESYRDFLKEMYFYLKKNRRGFSLRRFASDAGIRSYNYLKLVIDGQRNLSPTMIMAFAKGLKLKKKEAEFFEALVYFNQSKTAEEKAVYFERLKKFKQYREIKEIDLDQYEYFSNWYYAAIRELIQLEEFKEDPSWISQRLFPKITESQATEALDLLLRLKMIKRTRSGSLKVVESNIVSAPEVQNLSLMRFHQQMIDKARDSLDHVPSEYRDVSSVTIPVAPKDLEALKRKALKFREQMLSESAEATKEKSQIYQLNIQLFPLTSWEGLKP